MNNFGYGGANAHVIMEGFDSYKSTALHAQNSTCNGTPNGVRNGLTNGIAKTKLEGMTNGLSNGFTNGITNGIESHNTHLTPKIVIISAKDEQSTESMGIRLKQHLRNNELEDDKNYFDSLAYTLGQRRSRFPWVAAQSVQSLSGLLEAIESDRMKPVRTKDRPRLGFVFTGQGAQWHAMGRELIEAYPVFKASLLEAEGYLKELGATWSLLGKSPEHQTLWKGHVCIATDTHPRRAHARCRDKQSERVDPEYASLRRTPDFVGATSSFLGGHPISRD